MNSMTGYGRAAADNSKLDLTLELSSVNRKGLEVSVSLPREWQAMEHKLCEKIRSQVGRGKVSLSMTVKSKEASSGLSWDSDKVRGTVERMRSLATELGSSLEFDAQALLSIIKELQSDSTLPEWSQIYPMVEETLFMALNDFNQMRATEGDALESDIRSRLEALAQWCAKIQDACEGTVPRYRETLLERLQKAGLELDLSDERVLKEIALFADRCDITEELTRLESHLGQFTQTLALSEPVGRKLDFLCQEIHREANTIGSKANNIDVTRHVIEIKNELERIREQVQNIE